MKYLGIHKLIWFIFILIWTFTECLYWFIISIAYWLWCFKWIWNWGDFTFCKIVDVDQDSHGAYRIVHRNLYDNSIWDTIIRRYKGDLRI